MLIDQSASRQVHEVQKTQDNAPLRNRKDDRL